jgi:hypothetical protein
LAKDLDKRRHALLALADAEVRRADRDGSVTSRLRAARGYRASLRQVIWREAYKDSHEAVSPVQRADLERSWRQAVAVFEAARTWQERLAGLEGLREALGQLHRASPPSGAKLISFALVFPGGHVVEGPPFWSDNAQLIAAAEGGKPVSLNLSWPGPGRVR